MLFLNKEGILPYHTYASAFFVFFLFAEDTAKPEASAPITSPTPPARARLPAVKLEPVVPAVEAAAVATLKYTITLVALWFQQ